MSDRRELLKQYLKNSILLLCGLVSFCTNGFAFSSEEILSVSDKIAKEDSKESVKIDDRTFGFYLENDSRSIGGPGSDQGYTNGFKFSYLYAENKVPLWADPVLTRLRVVEEERRRSKSNFGIAFGQQIFTPNDTQNPDLIADDRPYAAWLYAAFSTHFKTPTHAHYWELAIGLVGHDALGEKVQNEYHRIIEINSVKGWKHQLGTEPTLQASYQQRFKFFEVVQGGERFFDIIPFFGWGLGNVLIEGHGGALMRFGYFIPDDLGPTRPSPTGGDIFISPEPKSDRWDWSLYGFVGARGHLVGRSIFLDGNTFRESHSVTRYPFVAQTEFGFAADLSNFNFIWRFVTKSPEFKEKGRFNSFASITMSYTFQ